jgi:hypothetical protein
MSTHSGKYSGVQCTQVTEYLSYQTLHSAITIISMFVTVFVSHIHNITVHGSQCDPVILHLLYAPASPNLVCLNIVTSLLWMCSFRCNYLDYINLVVLFRLYKLGGRQTVLVNKSSIVGLTHTASYIRCSAS